MSEFLLVSSEGVSSATVLATLRSRRSTGTQSVSAVGRQISPNLAVFHDGHAVLHEGPAGGGVGLFTLPPPGQSTLSPPKLLASIVNRHAAAQPPLDRALAGSFCAAAWTSGPVRTVAVADAFRSLPLYYAATARGFACATDLRWLLASGLLTRDVDPHALYHFLNFAFVPTPFSIFKEASKVPPGCFVEGPDRARVTQYWEPTYPEDLPGNDEEQATQLRRCVGDTVTRYRPDGTRPWGTFLSGGTDSSSISGILSDLERPRPVKSFSIGFAEPGYDELSYARLAAARFGLASHERRVEADDALSLIPRLVEAFDEPFGNASAIPTHCCAALAAEAGVDLLLAGDGGDEIFGGNERYRKDRLLGLYYGVPRPLRSATQAALRLVERVDWRPLNRVRNFVRRGSLPNPERFYTDDSFASERFEDLLCAEIRNTVASDESLDLLRRTFNAAPARSELNRLLYMDLRHAIADCDLVKVGRATRAAGVSVSYPFLDPDLVTFTGRLPARAKIRGLEKRFLFKKAMAGLLPEEILTKRKQGFGLPVSVWLRQHRGFRELVHDIVFSKRAGNRGYFEEAYIRTLLTRHEKGSWDHGREIFLLLMLELWHITHVDA